MADPLEQGRAWLRKRLRRAELMAQNALEIARVGRLGPEYSAPYKVFHRGKDYRLRRYGADDHRPTIEAPVLLIPPLMLHAEVYDIAPEVSPAARMVAAGFDVWVVDFGAPEAEEGGMKRTLDDHVLAIDDAIDHVRAATGHDVHVAGYSQGGMFAYQVAAYRRSAGIASLITFGSPVNVHMNIPKVGEEAAGQILQAAMKAAEKPLSAIEGLPGFLTSRGFKLLALPKELQQLGEFVSKLHDRQALEKRESRRRFLGGEGFVAWPGPALRDFIGAFVIENRMALGGFVLAGRAVTLADIDVPILYFVGLNDTIAQPASVRAIEGAAPNAECFEVGVKAGHFGIVVGSMAMSNTWPTVMEWIRWREGLAEQPRAIRRADAEPSPEAPEEAAFEDVSYDFELFTDAASAALSDLWRRIERVTTDVGDALDSVRYQIPRLSQLDRLEPDTPISLGRSLAEQARNHPTRTFFLWHGRAFTYADADRRVDNVVKGLVSLGIKPGQRVGVLMSGRPSYLSVVAALSRLGAVAVLLSPEGRRVALGEALTMGEVSVLVTDPENAERGREAFDGRVFVLGGFGSRRPLAEGVVDMESIDPSEVELPSWYEPNPGRARDLAMILFTASFDESPRAARITNRRWAFSAYGAAAACTLRPEDTVYCCLPLHHAAGILVSVGGALVGGSRLALADAFDPDIFWTEVRRYGATVVFYAGEMARALVDAAPSAADNRNPVRLFAGSGMRKDVWRRVVERFGPVGVLEFYASTEGNAVLANASGEKVGALGQPLPGSTEMALVAWDFEKEALARDARGQLVRVGVGEPGVLIAKVDSSHPVSSFDGYLEESETRQRIVRSAFADGDVWFVSGDLLRRDADGDYWFVDRLADVVRTASGPVFTRAVEDALAEVRGVARVVAFGVDAPDGSGQRVPAAAVVLAPGGSLAAEALGPAVATALPPEARPAWVRVVSSIPVTDGYRPLKGALQRTEPAPGETQLVYDPATSTYAPSRPSKRPRARHAKKA